jgi:hypothetical protein
MGLLEMEINKPELRLRNSGGQKYRGYSIPKQLILLRKPSRYDQRKSMGWLVISMYICQRMFGILG